MGWRTDGREGRTEEQKHDVMDGMGPCPLQGDKPQPARLPSVVMACDRMMSSPHAPLRDLLTGSVLFSPARGQGLCCPTGRLPIGANNLLSPPNRFPDRHLRSVHLSAMRASTAFALPKFKPRSVFGAIFDTAIERTMPPHRNNPIRFFNFAIPPRRRQDKACFDSTGLRDCSARRVGEPLSAQTGLRKGLPVSQVQRAARAGWGRVLEKGPFNPAWE
ncbi:unnamed protein product [Calypogeia fissa]